MGWAEWQTSTWRIYSRPPRARTQLDLPNLCTDMSMATHLNRRTLSWPPSTSLPSAPRLLRHRQQAHHHPRLLPQTPPTARTAPPMPRVAPYGSRRPGDQTRTRRPWAPRQVHPRTRSSGRRAWRGGWGGGRARRWSGGGGGEAGEEGGELAGKPEAGDNVNEMMPGGCASIWMCSSCL